MSLTSDERGWAGARLRPDCATISLMCVRVVTALPRTSVTRFICPKLSCCIASTRAVAAARLWATASALSRDWVDVLASRVAMRSEEHTSELQSLMRISYAVFCLKKKKKSHISMHITFLEVCTLCE